MNYNFFFNSKNAQETKIDLASLFTPDLIWDDELRKDYETALKSYKLGNMPKEVIKEYFSRLYRLDMNLNIIRMSLGALVIKYN